MSVVAVSVVCASLCCLQLMVACKMGFSLGKLGKHVDFKQADLAVLCVSATGCAVVLLVRSAEGCLYLKLHRVKISGSVSILILQSNAS
jgi:hypothetical protein